MSVPAGLSVIGEHAWRRMTEGPGLRRPGASSDDGLGAWRCRRAGQWGAGESGIGGNEAGVKKHENTQGSKVGLSVRVVLSEHLPPWSVTA